MQRKPGYPVANCNIKMPDSVPLSEAVPCDDDGDQQHRRQKLINFGHTQWGFNNWSWTVNKQDLDFVDFANGKYSAGVAAFVCVSVKTFDIRRENVGYATCSAPLKGSAIHQARKCAVTNALRETLLSFGGNVAAELLELLDALRPDALRPDALRPDALRPDALRPEAAPGPEPLPENNQNVANKPEPKNSPLAKNIIRKDSADSTASTPVNIRHPLAPPAIKNAAAPHPPPVAAALPMPASLPPAANRAPLAAPRAPAPPRPASNEAKVDPEEEARAERKRRQRQAQEEFRMKQLMRQKTDEQEIGNGSIDRLLSDIPTQDIVIEESGCKRKSPPPDGPAKRRGTISKLDIVETE